MTSPLGFEYYPDGFQYALDWQSILIGTSTFWNRAFSPSTNVTTTYLAFPPGIAVGIAILRVRSAGGGKWTVTPATGPYTPVAISSEVEAGDIPIKTMIVCAEEFFTGLIFESPDKDSEPLIYEVCVPQDPEACFATAD